MDETLYKIRFGNSWLVSDTYMTRSVWVDDRRVATSHVLKWAQSFRSYMISTQNYRVEIFTVDEADAMADREREDTLKRVWLEEFDGLMRIIYEPTWSSEGFWCNAHMLYHERLSVTEAVKKAGDKRHLRLTKTVR